MKPPEVLDIGAGELDELLERLRPVVDDRDFEIVNGLASTVVKLSELLANSKMTIRRLRMMLFGPKTEKKKAPRESKSNESENAKDKKPQRRKKGHGRNGANAYTGAERVSIPHSTIKSGDRCPECRRGKIVPLDAGVVVRVVGHAPLTATVYEPERLRCNLCLEVFTADLPPEVGDEKYDETAGTAIALLKCGSGMPFYRLQGLQQSVGVPLPASVQWELLARTADRCQPAYDELVRQAALGDLLHNDDTVMKVLALMKEDHQADRTGSFTTAIISQVNGHQIALFSTGREHAGESLAEILQQRPPGRSPPIQMCDALNRNLPKPLETILANCIAHGRRKFVEVESSFPDECAHVLELLAEVYWVDEMAKERQLSPNDRLRLHQQHSAPVMEELRVWMKEQLDGKKVEPNSGLGKAISYMQNHWEPLTLFLRVPGAPIDNNICERAIKFAILNRKNSMFYKTMRGAQVGDMLLSLIHTCRLHGANVFRYLNELQRHPEELRADPAAWMPWNFETTLELLGASTSNA